MKTLNSYLIHHTPPASQSPNISSGTLEALENAEKLVQEARQTIIEASYSVPTLDSIAERQPITTDVDENELYIRDVVTAKFQKANRQISSNTISPINIKTNLEINRPSRVRRIISKEMIGREWVRCRETKKKMETCGECLKSKDENKLRGKMSLGVAFHSGKSTRVDTKPQLSLRNVERLDLFPTVTNSEMLSENVKTYQYKHESSDKATINASLIDAAVQTSLCEVASKESSTSTNKLTALPVNDVQSTSVNQINNQDTIENSTTHLTTSERVNGEEELSEGKNTKKSKGSFLDFLQHMTELHKNERENIARDEAEQNHLEEDTVHPVGEEYDDDFDPNEIVLDPPNIDEFDEIISDLDGRMKKILCGIDELNNEYISMATHRQINNPDRVKFADKNTSPITVPRTVELPEKQMNLKIQNDKEKCSDARASVRFLLKPRSRISSTDSAESNEIMLPPSRFSTPLNNYRRFDDIVAPNIHMKNSRNSTEEFFIPITEPELKNDALKAITTRNKFSSVSSMDENFPEVEKKHGTVNIDMNSHPIVANNEVNEKEKMLSDVKTVLQSNNKSNESSKSQNVNTENKVDTEIVNNDGNETVTINNREVSDDKHEESNITLQSSHDSCKTLKSECAELNMDEVNNKTEEKKSIVILDKTNPTPPELSTRDRTSLDVSAIYSESFETSSVTELKSTSKDIINDDGDKNQTLIEENRVEIHSVNEAIDNAKNITKPIETSFLYSRENKTEISLSQLSKSSYSNYIKSISKIESDRNTISLSSSSTSSLRKVSSINSVSSSNKSNEFKKKFTADDCYSEGELYLPSSCSFSLGEIRIVERDQQNNSNKNYITKPSISLVASIPNSPSQSPGELLETDIESNSSLGKEH